MNIRDLSALNRTAVWLDELIPACERRGSLYGRNPDLARDVTRKAKALRTSLDTLRRFLMPSEEEEDTCE